MLETEIMLQLSIHQCLGEIKLKELLNISDNKDMIMSYNESLLSLYYKGKITINKETNTVSIKRILQ